MSKKPDCTVESLESPEAGGAEPHPVVGVPMGEEHTGEESTLIGEGGVAEDSMEGGEDEEEEEDEATWKVAHKKYQEFHQACEDLLDPGQSADVMTTFKPECVLAHVWVL